MAIQLNDLLHMMIENEASDLILKVRTPPAFRIDKSLVKAEDMGILTPEETKGFAEKLMNEEQLETFKEELEEDVAYALDEKARFRVNIFHQQGNVGLVFRLIKADVPTIENLTLPNVVYNISDLQRGLVLITGTTGSGKSSTLAGMIDYINTNKTTHIITIEDPIEFTHVDKQSIVTQREVGLDTSSFQAALVGAMRQNPDIILVGEMRDAATVDAAISAAETGHLVFSTLHTLDCAQTLSRILEFYPKEHHDSLRAQLAQYLMAVVSQRLVPKIGGGMVPAVEIMLQNPIVKKLIVQDRVSKIKSVLHQSRNEGMQTFDQSLVELYQAQLIGYEDAQLRCSKPANFPLYLEGHWPDVDAGIIGGM